MASETTVLVALASPLLGTRMVYVRTVPGATAATMGWPLAVTVLVGAAPLSRFGAAKALYCRRY